MTDYSRLLQPDRGQPARTITLIAPAGYDDWLRGQPARVRTLAEAQGFKAKAGASLIVPGDDADAWNMLAVVADPDALTAWDLAPIAARLPGGTYRLADRAPGEAAHGWLLAHYRFDDWRTKPDPIDERVLLTPEPGTIDAAVAEARAVALVRDLVNQPAETMGPADLEAAAARIAKAHGATLTVTQGDALRTGYPLIHAVGRAAERDRAPRLIELTWGREDAPRIAIVGKGVCFDSGGLDIKPGAGMLLMKKDMGGAAHALALAELVMAARLPVRLHLLIPAVENAIAGNAFRPGDIFRARAGTTVEIGNTDAEGRLILSDALTRAAEESPELILDFATLTGAARVALGPDLPALFANDDALADAMLASGRDAGDPLWRMPLWEPYNELLKSDIADVANAGASAFAGAVTAALFLQRFVPAGTPWAHLDTFAWRPTAAAARPKGGEALGLRAAWRMLHARYAR